MTQDTEDTAEGMLTEAWAFAEDEYKYRTTADLAFAVGFSGAQLLQNYPPGICVDFVEKVRERWPHMVAENFVNWIYIWALVKDGQNERAVEVFEQDVLTHPASAFRTIDKPTAYCAAAAYANLGRSDELVQKLRNTLTEHPKSVIAESISDYFAAD